MKKAIVLLIVVLLGVYNLSAQSPQSIKYQAIVRDEAGNILSNWDIGIRINILKGGQEGDLTYSEIHLVSACTKTSKQLIINNIMLITCLNFIKKITSL